MTEELDLETYLCISPNEFAIYLFDIQKSENIYEKKIEIKNQQKDINLLILYDFLKDNVFKIEKLKGKFLENIILLLETDDIENVFLCIKKKIYDQQISQQHLENMLIDAKDLLKESYKNKKILHMLICKYYVNNIHQPLFDLNTNGNSFSFEINFCLVSDIFVSKLDEVLEKFHIKINNYYDGKYIKNFFKDENLSISQMILNIQKGANNSEVKIIPKDHKKLGFFERFFQFFS